MSKYDVPNVWCQELVEKFHAQGYQIIFLTARNESYRELTESWVKCNVTFADYILLMRPDGDFRDDFIIKEMIYRTHIEQSFDVLFCVEDKQTVTDMWRSIGLICLQCDGDVQ